MERKQTHFKMYKIGRRWAFACAVLLTLGGTALNVKADDTTTSSSSDASTVATGTSSTPTSTAKLTVSTDAAAKTPVTSTKQAVETATPTSASGKQQAATASTQSSTASASASQASVASSSQSATSQSASQSATSQSVASQAAASQSTTSQATTATNAATPVAETTSVKASAKTAATKQTKATTKQATALWANKTRSTVKAANDAVADGGTVEEDFPDLHNLLGISSQFHIFAREAELNAHTNGNVAVGTLSGNVNFGTNIIEELLDKDISYIQNITKIANSSFVSAGNSRANKVIFGENVEIDLSNPNRPKVDGTDIDHLIASEVFQDKNGNVYIDFDKEFAALEKLSGSLSQQAPHVNYSNDAFTDLNQRVIDVSDLQPDADGHIIINLSPDVLNTSTPLTIKGLSEDKDGHTVIINVDTQGDQNYKVNSQIKIVYEDGHDRNNQETEDFGDNHLLWNFYDSTATDQLATGEISIDRPFQGSILAPKADVIANQNVDGNLIANKVVVNAETHRWDLQDNVDNEKDPEPGEYVKPVHPTIDVEMPDPDYEKPVHPTIDVEMPETDYEKPVHPTIDVEMPETDYEKPVHPTIDVEMPEIDYEKPVHPSIDVEMPETDYDKPVHPSIDVEMPDWETDEENVDEGETPEEVEEAEEDAEEAEEEAEEEAPEELEEAEQEEAEEEANLEEEVKEELEDGKTPAEVIDDLEHKVEQDLDDQQISPETVADLEVAFKVIKKEPVKDQIKDEKALLGLIDKAIVQAAKSHNIALVALLERLRAQVIMDIAVGQGVMLPQTGDNQQAAQAASLAGLLLAGTLVTGAYVTRRKRQN